MYEQRAANKCFRWVLGSHGIGVGLCVLSCDCLGRKTKNKNKNKKNKKLGIKYTKEMF